MHPANIYHHFQAQQSFLIDVPFTKEKTLTHGAKKTPITMNRKTMTKHHDIGSSVSKTCFWIIRFDDLVNT
jgi:hypothetical protein